MSHFLYEGVGFFVGGELEETSNPEKPHSKPHTWRALHWDAPGRLGTKFPYRSVGY